MNRRERLDALGEAFDYCSEKALQHGVRAMEYVDLEDDRGARRHARSAATWYRRFNTVHEEMQKIEKKGGR